MSLKELLKIVSLKKYYGTLKNKMFFIYLFIILTAAIFLLMSYQIYLNTNENSSLNIVLKDLNDKISYNNSDIENLNSNLEKKDLEIYNLNKTIKNITSEKDILEKKLKVKSEEIDQSSVQNQNDLKTVLAQSCFSQNINSKILYDCFLGDLKVVCSNFGSGIFLTGNCAIGLEKYTCKQYKEIIGNYNRISCT